MDYSIISSGMLQSFRESTQHLDEDLEGSKDCTEGRSGKFEYKEQLVLFDSLGYYLDDPASFYGEDILHELQITSNGSISNLCEVTNELLRGVGIYPNISAQGIGCVSRHPTFSPVENTAPSFHYTKIERSYNVYGCMQLAKKFHPSFDQVFVGILRLDPHAKFLLLGSCRMIIPRLMHALNYTHEEQIYKNFVFVPRTPHQTYLKLLTLTSVFLNPILFGAGVTSSEAIAMCIPVVVFPKASSVLPLAMTQVLTLGDDITQYLIANDVESYVQLSVDVANGRNIPLGVLKHMICAEKHRLFGKMMLEETANEWLTFLLGVKHKLMLAGS